MHPGLYTHLLFLINFRVDKNLGSVFVFFLRQGKKGVGGKGGGSLNGVPH